MAARPCCCGASTTSSPLQQIIDQPLFHTAHFPSSFYPREALPGVSVVEESLGEVAIAELTARPRPAGGAGLVGRAADRGRAQDRRVLSAAATPRLMQAYAVRR